MRLFILLLMKKYCPIDFNKSFILKLLKYLLLYDEKVLVKRKEVFQGAVESVR